MGSNARPTDYDLDTLLTAPSHYYNWGSSLTK